MEEEWVERGDFLLEGGLVGGHDVCECLCFVLVCLVVGWMVMGQRHDNVYGGEIDWLRGWGGGVI